MTAFQSSHRTRNSRTDTKITQKAERYEQIATKNKRHSRFRDKENSKAPYTHTKHHHPRLIFSVEIAYFCRDKHTPLMGLANNYQRITQIILIATAICLASCHKEREEGRSSYIRQLVVKAQKSDTTDFAQTDGHPIIKKNDTYAKIGADVIRALRFKSADKPDAAILYANSAIAGIKSSEDSASTMGLRLQAEMEYVAGAAYATQQDLTQTDTHLTTGAAHAIRGSYPAGIVKLSLFNAKAHCRAMDLNVSLAKLRQAELATDTAREETLNATSKTSAYSEIAGVAIDISDISTANRNLLKASETFDMASDSAKIAYLSQLARLRFLCGDMPQAITTLNRLELLIGKSGQRDMAQDVYAYQGLARARMQDADWATQFIEKVDTSKQRTTDGKIGYQLLKACVCDLNGDKKTAQRILFQDIPKLKDITLFERSIWDDCKIWHCEKTGDYEKANKIQSERNSHADILRNDILTINDRNREADVARAAALQAAKSTITPVEQQSQTILVIVATIIITLTITAIILFHIRRANRRAHSDEESKGIIDKYENRIAILEKQADALSKTNDRISESIAYAEHIQHAISPSPEQLNAYPITGSFVFYSPLDVVSGDFFWFKSVGDNLVIACADCTGHGVPGALLSMISATILNETCNRMDEEKLDPAKILEQLDRSLIQNLRRNKQNTEDVKDGLDISIAVLNVVTHDVQFAAARRPIIIIHNGIQTTIRGTRRSIGDTEPVIRCRPFETTRMKLRKYDKIYMYTDGYSDQFGGLNGEKLKNTKIEHLLSSICDDDMDQQSLTIQEAFTQWKGDYPQNDDVTFIGISV